MRYIKLITSLILTAVMAGCGGGGADSGTPTNGGGSNSGTGTSTAVVTPAAIEILTSANTLASAGAEVQITTFVKSSANVALPGQTVSFSASSGILQANSVVTNASGVASARLSAGADKTIRDITLTAKVGSVVGQVVIPVTGTRLSIVGNATLQAGGSTTQYQVRALDSAGNPISGATIKASSALGNAVSPTELTTDSSGNSSLLYTPNNAGTDKLNVTGLGTSGSLEISINASDFVALSPSSNTQVPVGQSQTVTVRYRLSGAGVAGKTVYFSTSRGNVSTQSTSTNAAGEASVSVTSATAGPAVVTAQITGVGQVNLPLQFVATTPATIVIQANPGAVAPNISGTGNQSTIEAIVRDSAGNAVANRQVNFTTLNDVSNGLLSPGVATTDLNGRARVQFIPGANTTPANGVVIQGTVASTTISSTASLTVNGQALFISIGFGNTIGNVDETTYNKQLSVYVTDANGVAVGGQNVTLAAIPGSYIKGYMTPNIPLGKWVFSNIVATCANEDVNLNGVLDPGEDVNGNSQLTPGNVVIATPGSVITDAAGRATFNLQYGEQYAGWVDVNVIARASVGGTESRSTLPMILPVAAADLALEGTPAGVTSPFGTSASCTDPN